MRHIPVLALLCMIATSAAYGQPLVETIDVRIASVDVVVVDKKGNPVGGLRPEDFVVKEDGKVQVITNFSELVEDRRMIFDDGQVPRSDELVERRRPEPRHLLLVIDRLRLFDRPNREQYFRGLRDFVQDSLRVEDRASIVEWRGSGFMTTVPFTSDAGPLVEALNRIERDSAIRFGVPSYEVDDRYALYAPSDEELDLDRRGGWSPLHATQRSYDQIRKRIESVRAIFAGLSGIDGRKIVVLSMHRMPLDPGVEFGYTGRDYRTVSLLDALVRDANAAGVTLHAFWAEGLSKSMSGADTAGPGPQPIDDYRLASTEGAAVESVASRTGGQSGMGGVRTVEKLSRALAQLDNSYSIAWRTDGQIDGKPRRIDIDVRQRGLRVIHRTSYVEKSSQQLIDDKLVATALFSPQKSEIYPTVSVGRPSPAGRYRISVPIDVSVPLGQLTLLPADGRHEGGFSVFALPVNHRGELGDVLRDTRTIEISSENLDTAGSTQITLSVNLMVHERSPRAAIAVVDNITGATGYLVVRLPD